jgi:hypothetical protein
MLVLTARFFYSEYRITKFQMYKHADYLNDLKIFRFRFFIG